MLAITDKGTETQQETDLLRKLEIFFSEHGPLPQNDWSHVSTIDSLPIILIKNRWLLHYPLNHSICRTLIAECSPTPFGRGTETFYDRDVRNSWQLEAGDVQIKSEPWLQLFSDSQQSRLLEEIRQALAPNCSRIYANFYKLLAYEPGSFFKSHRDTQRDRRHFGSVVVFLPSTYAGGELVVRHAADKAKQRTHTYSVSEMMTSMLKCHVVSFFADCEHEVLPVRSGFRVTLCYDLFYDGPFEDEPKIPVPIYGEKEVELDALLNQLFELDAWKFKEKSVGLILRNKYSPHLPLLPQSLKGYDKICYETLTGSDKFQADLTPVTVVAEGQAGDNEANEHPLKYYEESLRSGYEMKLSVYRFNPAEKLHKQQDEENQTEEELLGRQDWQGGPAASDEGSSTMSVPPSEGPVHFVSDWKENGIAETGPSRSIPTSSEGTMFTLQYRSAAMLIKPKSM